MKYMPIFVALIVSFLFAQPHTLSANEDSILSEKTQQEVQEILESNRYVLDNSERVERISRHFKDRPFSWGPCGEGSEGVYEPKPLTQFESFDCTTYVEAVLGLTFSAPKSTVDAFVKEFKDIKYVDSSNVCYPNRNHFASINWVPNIINKGYLKDITKEIYPESPVRMKWLDVKGWYAKKIADLKEAAPENLEAQLAELNLQSQNKEVSPLAQLPYIPLSDLLKDSVQQKLLEEKVVLFNLIRNEHTKVNIPVIIGHQGFIIAEKGTLIIRQASQQKKVEDLDFTEYVKTRMKDTTWPSLGFHLLGLISEE